MMCVTIYIWEVVGLALFGKQRYKQLIYQPRSVHIGKNCVLRTRLEYGPHPLA